MVILKAQLYLLKLFQYKSNEVCVASRITMLVGGSSNHLVSRNHVYRMDPWISLEQRVTPLVIRDNRPPPREVDLWLVEAESSSDAPLTFVCPIYWWEAREIGANKPESIRLWPNGGIASFRVDDGTATEDPDGCLVTDDPNGRSAIWIGLCDLGPHAWRSVIEARSAFRAITRDILLR
jgi:hypothetical protein